MKWEGAAYWLLFVGTFLAVAVWESFRPRSPLALPAGCRWGGHAMLLALSVITQTVLLRVSPVVVAVIVAGSRFGVLNRPWLPVVVRYAAALLLLDLTHYAIHKAFHSVSFLWRIHEVHHSDPDYDVSTAGRFHPFEVVLTQGAYLAAVALRDPSGLRMEASRRNLSRAAVADHDQRGDAHGVDQEQHRRPGRESKGTA